MRKNDAFDAKIVNTRLTKIFIAIFAPDERLPSSATLAGEDRVKMRTMMKPLSSEQCGRTWQPFGDKNGHENFRQTRIYNFRDKCVVFARNRKFANLTQ